MESRSLDSKVKEFTLGLGSLVTNSSGNQNFRTGPDRVSLLGFETPSLAHWGAQFDITGEVVMVTLFPRFISFGQFAGILGQLFSHALRF